MSVVTLDTLSPGHEATIESLDLDAGFRQRLQALGLRCGRPLSVERQAALGGPLVVRVGPVQLMLRRRDAHGITVRLSA